MENYDLIYRQDRNCLREAVKDYVAGLPYEFSRMSDKEARDSLLSEYNYKVRSKLKSCRSFGLNIEPGDVCYIDFGRAYVSEAGYQHFGLVLKVFNGKAFVLPMTSNRAALANAYEPDDNPEGVNHLYRIGAIEGLTRESVLFLNDCKFINTARIIDIKGHIDPESEVFRQVYSRFLEVLSPE